MTQIPNSEVLLSARAEAENACEHLSLAPTLMLRTGVHGGWLSQGRGSSLDFEDYRRYVPGDDPRHLDWRAFARTDNYMMKSFQRELSPRIDIIFDCSASMMLGDAKSRRSLELLYFALIAGQQVGASITCTSLSTRGVIREPIEAISAGQMLADLDKQELPLQEVLGQVSTRACSQRIFISDLLYPSDPQTILGVLGREQGNILLLVPYDEVEAQPDWRGHLELKDCETGVLQRHVIDDALRAKYILAYQRHFELWHSATISMATPMLRVPTSGSLLGSLEQDAFEQEVFSS